MPTRSQVRRAGESSGRRSSSTTAMPAPCSSLMTRAFQGLLFAALDALVRVRPEQAVATRLGRRGDALTDGLEDLRLAEIGNHQPEQQAFRGPLRGAAHVGARAGDAVQQAALL